MPWRQEPKKDVGGCDKPGGDADQSLIPGFPNGGNLRVVMRAYSCLNT